MNDKVKKGMEREAADTENVDVVGNTNERQISERERIAQSSEEFRTRDTGDGSLRETFEDTEEEETRQEATLEDEEAEDEEEENPDEQEEAKKDPPPPAKHKIKVRGQEMELTTEELIARAQKVENADLYMQEASEALKKVSTHGETNPTKKADELTEDDVALARALQMGSEEEAARVIQRLRTPSLKPDELTRVIDERHAFQSASEWVQEEYAELFKDDDLRSLFLQKDSALLQGGDKRPYTVRYKEIGDALMKKFGKPQADKLERKRQNVVDIKAAAGRKTEPVEDDHEPTSSEIIRAMAKTRGQSL